MNQRILLCVSLILVLAGCAPGPVSSGGICQSMPAIAKAFYDANDAGQTDTSLSYLTEDVSLVFWAEGTNGHHVSQKFAVGKDQVALHLSEPGFRRTATQAGGPNFCETEISPVGNKLTFKLVPDRLHPNGRTYNPYVVELVFNRCKIEIIKVVERVTWL
jgi:hypothetical protein